MKKFRVICLGMMLLVLAWGGQSQSAQAAGSGTILAGIYLDDISLEGMTTEEAESMVDSKLTEWSKKQITLVTVDDHEVQITPAEIALAGITLRSLKRLLPLVKKEMLYSVIRFPRICSTRIRYLPWSFPVMRICFAR